MIEEIRASNGFARDPSKRYEMPIFFGPTDMPDVSIWSGVEMVSTGFVTTAEAVRPFVPVAFDLPDEPTVTFSRMTYAGVDYLAGRGYNELTVGVTATYAGAQSVRGSFMLAVWVDDARAISAGREFLGYGKLGGELPPVQHAADRWSYDISEYGTTLLRTDVRSPVPIDGGTLDLVNASSADVSILCWKHVCGPEGVIDADYPVLVKLRFDWDEVTRAEGETVLAAPSWQDAPHSARIIAALSALPVVRRRPAMVAVGSGRIDRAAARQLK